MREKRSPNGQPDDARTQRTILNLLLDPDRQRPFSEAELARATGEQTAAKVAIGELYDAGIIHRWEQLVTATHPAVRYHELTHGERADLGARHEHTLIELLLEEPEHGAHETRLIDTLAAVTRTSRSRRSTRSTASTAPA